MAVLVQFDRRGQWGDTRVCDALVRAGLRAHGISHGRWPPSDGEPLPPPGDDSTVRYVRDGPTLFYLPVREGWLGLLCDAGEWVAFPADQRHWVAGAAAASVLPAALPPHEEFVDRLLAMTGDEPVDEAM